MMRKMPQSPYRIHGDRYLKLSGDGQSDKKPNSVDFRLPILLNFKYIYVETNHLPGDSQVCIFEASIVLYRQLVIAEYPSK